jgi:hypothetical protein
VRRRARRSTQPLDVMDERERNLCTKIRAMRSDEAANWLLETYKVGETGYGEAFLLLRHRSWAREDQLRLARYYLQRIPFASGLPYEAFATFMPIRTLVGVVREHLPNVSKDRLGLLQYYLCPLIKEKARTSEDNQAADELIAELNASTKAP